MERVHERHGSIPGSSSMNTTVVVCTYNRCQSLAAVLKSLAVQVMPESVTWEVVVVDNNSTDKTREVTESAICECPERFRYIFEQRQGLSVARNRGIREARGTVIAFTDDDVMINPDWLHNLTSNLRTGNWAGAGGRIVPVWAKPLPAWMSIHDQLTMGAFVQFDAGPEPGELRHPPYGANMAFHRRTFEKYGGFRTDLGRTGKSLQSHEDTEYGDRLLAAGERLWYEPHATVLHPAPENRMTRDFVLRWWFWFGYGEVVQKGPPTDARWVVNGIPLNFLRRIARWTLQSIVTFNPARRFGYMRTACHLAGMVLACYQRSRNRGPRENEASEGLHVTLESAPLQSKSPRCPTGRA